MLAESLIGLNPTKFANAAGRVASARNAIFDTTSRACRKALAAITNPKKPWHSFTVYYNRDYGLWAARLSLAGRTEEAKHYYRKEGFDSVRRGKNMLGYAKSTLARNGHDFGAFQIRMAIDYFLQAASFFQKAESEINRIKVLTLVDTTRRELNVVEGTQPKKGGVQRVTFLEMLSVFERGEEGPDQELVHYARFAAIGGEEGMEIFLRKAAEVLAEAPEAILEALANPQQHIADRLADGAAKLLGLGPIVVDPDVSNRDSGIADMNGVGIFGELQKLIGKENIILEHLIRAARRYKEKKSRASAA